LKNLHHYFPYFFWIHFKESLDKREGFFVHFAQESFLDCFWLRDFVELHADIARVLEECFLLFVGKWPERFLDEVELVDFGLAWEQRLAIGEFPENAPDCPEVNAFAIVVQSEEELWRTVPACRNIIRHVASFLGKHPCEPEVAKF
jgi:hypothetical protein